ncbi:MAG: NUDIX domain-containing protein, partial [Eggerthellaceae bacterium]|nr:NUDIX domain-containing protein [Eggerthellaceae bacterium]
MKGSPVSDTIELIDIYDENRELTGVILPRGTFLAPGQFQLYALAMICNAEGRILITQRSENESWGAGWWEIPGGGVPAGETSAFAIVREVREETGLDVSGCEPELLYSYTNINSRDAQIGFALKFWDALTDNDINLAMDELKAYLAGIPYVEGFKEKLNDAATREGFYEYTLYLIFS